MQLGGQFIQIAEKDSPILVGGDGTGGGGVCDGGQVQSHGGQGAADGSLLQSGLVNLELKKLIKDVCEICKLT